MSLLQQERYTKLKHCLKGHGAQLPWDCCNSKLIVMTFHDVAHALNNSWNAELFLSEKQITLHCYHDMHKPVLKEWKLYEMFRGIRHACKFNNDIQSVIGENGIEYVEYIN